MDTTNTAEILASQGKNTLESMKELQHRAAKKNKERSNLYEKFCANEHSFRVYTYMDSKIGNLAEVQTFLDSVGLFDKDFTGVNTDFETNVNKQQAEYSYKEATVAYNEMVRKLGFEREVL